MTSDGDPYDLDNLKVTGGGSTPKRIRRRQPQFVKIPRAWVDAITPKSRDKTLAVIWHLLHEDWKQGGGRPIKMPNGMLAIDGVGRMAKWRVLNMLEGLGLIAIERRPNKSPIVIINTEKP